MMRFFVIGAPRSGTAWCANWLTDNGIVCHHDPLWDYHYSQFDDLPGENGIACTGMALFPDWLNNHPAPKVILHRAPWEIQASLQALGFPSCKQVLFDNLWRVRGMHVDWRWLFSRNAIEIHRHLKIGEMNMRRWNMLKDMRVTANYWQRKQNPHVLERLIAEGAFA